MRWFSLRAKLLVAFVIPLIILAVLTIKVASGKLNEELERGLLEWTGQMGKEMTHQLTKPLSVGDTAEVERIVERYKAAYQELSYVIVLHRGEPIVMTFEGEVSSDVMEERTYEPGGNIRNLDKVSILRGENIHGFIFSVPGSVDARVFLGVTDSRVRRLVSAYALEVGRIVFAAVLVTMLSAYLFSLRVTARIRRLQEGIQRIARGDIDTLIPLQARDEVGELAFSFNQMIHRLKGSVEKLNGCDEELRETQKVSIMALAKIAEFRDESTGKHLERVMEFTRILAEEIAWEEEYADYITPAYIDDISFSSILHDIGKVGTPDEVLLKPGKLTPEEFEVIKQHPTIGGDALAAADKKLGKQSFLTMAKEIAYHHHERLDGAGYPKGLKGKDIPLSARIVALADVYDALTSDRCYRKALSHSETKMMIVEQEGKHFDPVVVKAFLAREQEFIEVRRKFSDEDIYPLDSRLADEDTGSREPGLPAEAPRAAYLAGSPTERRISPPDPAVSQS